MNKRSCVALVLLSILVLSVTALASAQIQASPGVSVGNSFTFSNTFFWTSSNPAEVVAPPAYRQQNESTLRVTVETVTGATVGLEEITTYRNGTSAAPRTNYYEVYGGSSGGLLVYSANLTAGTRLFPGNTELPFVINNTEFRVYGETYRETNHIVVNNTGIEGKVYSHMNLYFDKATGMVVEYRLTEVSTSAPSQTITQHLLLIDSNVWNVGASTSASPGTTPSAPNLTVSPSGTEPNTTASSLPFELVLIIIVVIVAVGIIAGLFLLRKPVKKAPTPTVEAPPTS